MILRSENFPFLALAFPLTFAIAVAWFILISSKKRFKSSRQVLYVTDAQLAGPGTHLMGENITAR